MTTGLRMFMVLFVGVTLVALVGSLAVPRLRAVAGVLCLGLCTAALGAWAWASAIGRDVGGFDVWSSFFRVGGLGIGELVWAQRTARTAPARSTT